MSNLIPGKFPLNPLHRDVARVQAIIEETLQKLEPLFIDAKITFVARSPGLQDGDMIITKDDLDEVIKSIENLKRHEIK